MSRFRNSRFFIPTITLVGIVWILASYSLPVLQLRQVIDWPLWLVWAPLGGGAIILILIILMLGSGAIQIEPKSDRGLRPDIYRSDPHNGIVYEWFHGSRYISVIDKSGGKTIWLPSIKLPYVPTLEDVKNAIKVFQKEQDNDDPQI